MLYHEEERSTIFYLYEYIKANINKNLIFEFAEGDSYKCRFSTMGESDNEYECETFKIQPDEFWEMNFNVLEVIKIGVNCIELEYGYKCTIPKSERFKYGIVLTYKHFPIRITSENGEHIYDAK